MTSLAHDVPRRFLQPWPANVKEHEKGDDGPAYTMRVEAAEGDADQLSHSEGDCLPFNT